MIPESIRRAAISMVESPAWYVKEEDVQSLRRRALRAIEEYKDAKKSLENENKTIDEVKQWLTDNNIEYEAKKVIA